MLDIQYKTEHKIPLFRDHGIEYQASNVLGRQLLLNYCFGSPAQSNILLLPMAPAVPFINHSSQQPNVQIRWSSAINNSTKLREELPVMELLEQAAGELVVELVALREIDGRG